MTNNGPVRTLSLGLRSIMITAVSVLSAMLVALLSVRSVTSSPAPAGASQRLGEADGAVPSGTTIFDDLPAVANLDPDLLRALRRAATDAAADGVTIIVNSGWRTPAYQDQLLRRAIKKYGSAAEAARWVATPERSIHVAGRAIDLGPAKAQAWLAEHGAGYGLCRIYHNEPWHFELRPEAVGGQSPQLYPDPSHDPRLRP